MTAPSTAQRIVELEAMLAAREGRPGFTRNVEAIKQELERLRSQT